MAYSYRFKNSAVDDLNKLIKHNPSLAVELIVEHIPAIVQDPKAVGEKKKGELSELRACAFAFRGSAYRIVYRVDEQDLRVIIVAIGVHDVAYRQARDR